MVRKLYALLEKEVKDLLRDPRIYLGLILPALIFPIMGIVMSATLEPIVKGPPSLTVGLVDQDRTQTSFAIREFLENYGLVVKDFEDVQGAISSGPDAVLVIPRGFEHGILSRRSPTLSVYFIFKNLDPYDSSRLGALEIALSRLNDHLSTNIILELGDVDPNFVKSPLRFQEISVLKNRELTIPPSALMSQMFGQLFFIPLVIFMLSIVVAQIAATSTAVENEEKTLETLLTLPIDRASILMAKLLASTIIAVIGTAIYMVGFQFYMSSFSSLLQGGEVVLEPPSPSIYIILAISLLLSILFTTSLGVVIGTLSNDVRIANSLLPALIIPIMIPSLVLMLGGSVEGLPLGFKLAMLALPTTYPMILSRSVLVGEVPIEAILGIPYSALLTLIVIYFTSKLLEPERLFRIQYTILKRRKRF